MKLLKALNRPLPGWATILLVAMIGGGVFAATPLYYGNFHIATTGAYVAANPAGSNHCGALPTAFDFASQVNGGNHYLVGDTSGNVGICGNLNVNGTATFTPAGLIASQPVCTNGSAQFTHPCFIPTGALFVGTSTLLCSDSVAPPTNYVLTVQACSASAPNTFSGNMTQTSGNFTLTTGGVSAGNGYGSDGNAAPGNGFSCGVANTKNCLITATTGTSTTTGLLFNTTTACNATTDTFIHFKVNSVDELTTACDGTLKPTSGIETGGGSWGEFFGSLSLQNSAYPMSLGGDTSAANCTLASASTSKCNTTSLARPTSSTACNANVSYADGDNYGGISGIPISIAIRYPDSSHFAVYAEVATPSTAVLHFQTTCI